MGIILLLLSILNVEISHAQADSSKNENKKGLPLEAARSIPFTSTEATWLSLDVSPDGSQIVFDFLGDLYRMPIAGGKAEALTSDLAFEGQARFSPDGKFIVYTSDRSGGENIWTMDLGSKEEKQLTKGNADRYQSPEWTPDGEYIIASKAGMRSGSLTLWMYHKDGGGGTKLIEKPDDLKTTGAAFNQEERYIWFAERRRDWQYNAIFPQYQIAQYDRETGEKNTLTTRYGSAFRPTLSPDGKWLVYGTRHDEHTGLMRQNLETGEEKWLAYPVQHDDQESRGTRDALPGMSFSPDSKNLLASYGGKIWKLPITGGAASEIPFEVKTELAVGPRLDFDYPIEDSEEFTVKQIRDVVVSPNGKRLAFTALNKLYVMDLPAGSPQSLTSDAHVESMPAWSADGNWIAYVSWEGEAGNIYKVRSNGNGQPQKISNEAAYYQTPVWSPKEDRIVAIKAPASAFRNSPRQRAFSRKNEIVWFPANGGAAQLIAPAKGRNFPHFDSSGDRIYLSSSSEGLISIRWDGSDEKNHIKITGEKAPGANSPVSAKKILISPDGKSAIAEVYWDIYWVKVPYVGGKVRSISVSNPDNSSFPSKKLSDIGGQFLSWGAGGKQVHWAIGNAFATYDLDAAAQADSAYEVTENIIEVSAKRDIPQGSVLLRNARLITMKGNEIISRGDIYIQNNRIKGIGRSGSIKVPSGTRRWDMKGKTIVPGFVDTHAHLRPAWGVHKDKVWQYLTNLAYGVTTTRDPQTSSTDVLTYEDMVRSGDLTGPRIYSTGPGVFWNEQIKSLDHARKILSRYSKYYDTKTIKMYVAGNRQQRQWIIMAAKEQELMPTTEGSLNFKQNLTQVIDGYPGHEHSFPVFPIYSDVIKLVTDMQTCYTPTLLVAYGGPWAENYFYTRENPHNDEKLAHFTPHDVLDAKTRRRGQGSGPGPGGWFMDEEHVFVELAEFVKDLVEAGGKAGVGSHGQLQGLGFHWELWAMQSGGASPHDALKMATIFGAEGIGLEKELGSLEVGKLADLLILSKNPLSDIRNTRSIEMVMKNGRLYEADSMNEIFPNQKEAGSFYWKREEPVNLPGVNN